MKRLTILQMRGAIRKHHESDKTKSPAQGTGLKSRAFSSLGDFFRLVLDILLVHPGDHCTQLL
jgi:hypothetical protein